MSVRQSPSYVWEVEVNTPPESDDKPRDVDFSVVFPNESAAEKFVGYFQRSDFRIAVQEAGCEPELAWDVTVTRYMLPTHAGITDIEKAIEEVATPLGGATTGGAASVSLSCISLKGRSAKRRY